MSLKTRGEGRGGKRAGAGRKPSLTWEQKIAIVAEYQTRWWQLQLDEVSARAEALRADTELSKDWADATSLAKTPNERARAVELSELPEDSWPAGLADREQDAASALMNYQKNLKSLTERKRRGGVSPGIATFGTRPHGKRDKLELEVADWANKEFGIRITARIVRRSVDEWKRSKSLE